MDARDECGHDDGEIVNYAHPLRRHRQPAQGVPPRLRAVAPTRSPTGSASRAPRSTASRRASWPRSRRWRSSPSCSASRCRRCSASASNTSRPPVAYFERMRQIEETSEHIIVLAGPISYLLASDAFDRTLEEVLRENVPDKVEGRKRALDAGRRADGRAAPAQGKLSQAPARHRQSDRGLRDGTLPAQRPGRPLRPAGEDAAPSGARSPAPRPSTSPR